MMTQQMQSTAILAGVVVIGWLFYYMYKKFRGPAYIPGSVADKAITPNFDDPNLSKSSTETTWKMPEGIDIYHFPVEESKEPPTLGVHGGPSFAPAKPWRLCKEVPSFYLYHARGCGKSTRPISKFPTLGMWPGIKILEETLGIGAQVADIERIRRRLDAEKIAIVGHSFGRFIATLYAAEFPEHVKSLVLLVPAAVLKLPRPKGEFDFFQTVQKKLEEVGTVKDVEEYKDFLKRYFDFSSLPKATDESLAKLHNEFSTHYFRAENKPDERGAAELEGTGGMAAFATFISMGMEHDYKVAIRERLRTSSFPVRIAHGSQDMVEESTSREYINLFPEGNVSFETVDGSHSLFDHERVVEIVRATRDQTA